MKNKIILILILILGFSVRLYKTKNPIADWHSWRQADTSAVSRNFIKHSFDLLHPKFDDLSNVASGDDNPKGYRFVEFPIYNVLQAKLFQVFKFFNLNINLEISGRLVSIFASLFSAYFLYLITKNKLNQKIGRLSMMFFLVLSVNIYYSRVILPGPLMVLFSLASTYFLIKSNFVLSSLLASLAILTKPYAIFILIPSWISYFLNHKKNKKLVLNFLFLGLASFLPFLLWRFWIKNFPEGIPVNQWLLNKDNIRLRPAWFRWLFAERIGKLILGYWGLILLGFGLITKKTKILFLSWGLGMLAYLIIFAGGNVQHDYYQILLIPVISIYLARGANFLVSCSGKFFNKITCYLLLVTCSVFTFAFSWYQVREYYKINNPAIIEAGQEVNKILPPNAKVIAPYNGDTAFLYQTNRQGWPIPIYDFDKLKAIKATHYVSVNFDDLTNQIMQKYKILEQNNKYVIVDLTHEKEN